MRSVGTAVLGLLFTVATAWARPSHGVITELARGRELDAARYFPLDIGRSWIYRDSVGTRYRHMVVAPTPLLAADRKDRDRLRRRVVFEVPEHGASKVIERRLFDIDPTRGIVSRGERDEAGQPGPSTGSQRELELPRWLAAGVSWRSYGIEHRVQGLADLDVEAGSFHECVVIDAKNAHTLPGGARTDLRSFYCPDVGEAAALVMVGGAWRPAMELESWVSPQAADTKLDTPGAR